MSALLSIVRERSVEAIRKTAETINPKSERIEYIDALTSLIDNTIGDVDGMEGLSEEGKIEEFQKRIRSYTDYMRNLPPAER